MRHKLMFFIGFIIIFAVVAWYAVISTNTEHIMTDAVIVNDQESANLELVKQYRARIEATREQSPPILNVAQPTNQQLQAFDILARSPKLSELTRANDGSVYRTEVLQSYKLPPGQAVDQLTACESQQCYRMDLFNFTLNTSIVVIVNLNTQQILKLQAVNMQPELSTHLADIAKQIATHSPHVKKAFGDKGTPIMASTKTALEKTVCEKSRHLCVAPTFVAKDKKSALWVIVDLTDLKIIGTSWTKWSDKPEPVTERQLKTQVIEDLICGKVVSETRGDWKFNYTLTSSDGLEIRDVRYKGDPVIASAKNVDWHVSYSGKDGFGYSDAVGCPVFSTAAVVPSKLPEVNVGQDGQIILNVDFEGEKWPEPCNYYYRQQFQMNPDGSLRVAVANLGRGCGDDGTYRPVTRIELPKDTHNLTQNSKPMNQEMWWQPGSCKEGANCSAMTYTIKSTTYDVIPGNGQFGDGGRGDNPFLYTSVVNPSRLEGQEDLLTIGPCCNVDFHQGPEAFVNNEPFTNQTALWYVAQLKNSDSTGEEYCWANNKIVAGRYEVSAYPCYSGPLIKPRKGS